MSEDKAVVEMESTESLQFSSYLTSMHALTFLLSWGESEEELLQFLEAELERTREKKEKAIGAEAYAFLCRKERMLEKGVSKLHVWRQFVEQVPNSSKE